MIVLHVCMMRKYRTSRTLSTTEKRIENHGAMPTRDDRNSLQKLKGYSNSAGGHLTFISQWNLNV